MSHTGVDVIDFLLLATYPAVALLGVELVHRLVHMAKWAKLAVQAAISVAFAVAYVVALPTPHWLTAIVLIALAAALGYQARRAALDPASVSY